ncbi:MAG TPA: A24 family peptidase [Acidimicrobiales bacterium]|nr:A24 family peptidase [Acidimicrobiales bacterium]
MGTAAVTLSTIAGVLVGWFVIVRVVETIPEPSPLEPRARVAVAVVNGLLWLAVANKSELHRWWVAVVYFLVFSTLLAVSAVDLRVYRIPDRIVFPALGLTAVLMVVATFAIVRPYGDVLQPLEYALVGMATFFAILFVFHVIYPAGMGFGDVKLALLMGLSLGWVANGAGSAAYLVMIALFIGSLVGIVFGLLVRVARGRGGAFPFGPALAFGTVFVVLNFQNYLI